MVNYCISAAPVEEQMTAIRSEVLRLEFWKFWIMGKKKIMWFEDKQFSSESAIIPAAQRRIDCLPPFHLYQVVVWTSEGPGEKKAQSK